MTTQYTTNFRLQKPDFRTSPWSGQINDNSDRIDALIYNALTAHGVTNFENGVVVYPGTTMYDPDLNTFFVNTTQHTTIATGTFIQERAANPYWIVLNFAFRPRGEWAHSTFYEYYDLAYDPVAGIAAVCIEPHASPATGTINDEIDKWTIIFEISDISGDGVAFDPTGTSLTSTNVQDALVELDDDLTTAVGNALQASQNLADLLDADTAITNLGGTSVGAAIFKAISTAVAQTALGGTTVGKAMFVAADAAAGRTAISAPGLGVVNTFTDTTVSTTPTTGSMKLAGGLGVNADINWLGAGVTTFTPTQSGTATGTSTGRYKLFGKLMYLFLEFTCTSSGTIILSMPSGITGPAGIDNQYLVGFRNSDGNLLFGVTTTNNGTFSVKTPTFTDPAGSGVRIALSGMVYIA